MENLPLALRYAGEISLQAPPESVRAVLMDVDELVRCLPGYKSHKTSGNRVEAVVEVSLGPVSGDVRVTAEITSDDSRVALRGEGYGLMSRISFELEARIEEKGAGESRILWVFQGVAEGLAAKLDKRLIDYIASTWTRRLEEKIAERVKAGSL